MKKYLKEDPWKIIEEGFDPLNHRSSESIFSLGNGHMGQRANFEESYSGPSLQGNYLAGIYYPDKTRVGWWKNGYPEYFAKVLNAPSWIGINIRINNQELDLYKLNVIDFTRTLDMKQGILYRDFKVEFEGGEIIRVHSERFLNLDKKETGSIRYVIKIIKGSGKIEIASVIDGDISNQDSNYDEKFWDAVDGQISNDFGTLTSRTRKTGFTVATTIANRILLNNVDYPGEIRENAEPKKISFLYKHGFDEGDKIEILKFAAIVTSRDYPESRLKDESAEKCREAFSAGYDALKTLHLNAWTKKWEESDIRIEGDVSAQQGIRFSIFQLNQTYTGHDPRLNIGPKGFTGEKYGGSTYWDTEAFCLPFYMKTANKEIARNLLIYRYNHLSKAIENAEKLGLNNGAALYPMVTMNGEECHNEWEITFEEIHRNGAIVYAIHNYLRYTGDYQYLFDYGIDVIVGVARFWAQRVNFSKPRGKYVILGVTGPNEYENNVNNNWYTNYLAAWSLSFAVECLDLIKNQDNKLYNSVIERLGIDPGTETSKWPEISKNIYLPEDKKLGIFLQQDGFLDKELIPADNIPPDQRPINQNWSWDRILRSCYIKQADVLQGLYFFEEEFDESTHRRNFNFYEPITVHESSLSPSLHVILACKLGLKEKAYELYRRTARLDLDDYNNEVHEGCHITSMAGSWLAVVEGFGGMRIKDDKLSFAPLLPESWKGLKFIIRFRGRKIRVNISKNQTDFELLDGNPLTVLLNGKSLNIS